MGAQLAADDHLSGLPSESYSRRSIGPKETGEIAVRLGEIKVDIGYIRKDVDELRDFSKSASKEFIALRTDIQTSSDSAKVSVSAPRSELFELKGKISALPTYKEMFMTISLLLTVFAAVILFADRIKHWAGLG